MRVTVITTIVGLVGVAFLAGRALAGGAPTSGPLTYSGLLQDAGGAPLSSPQFVEVRLWNSATASDVTSNLLCDSGTPASVALQAGHFSLVLPDQCTTSIAASKDVWAEVIVGPSAATGASLGRSKLGAVPYAIEANHAVNADSAATAASAAAAHSAATAASAVVAASAAIATSAAKALVADRATAVALAALRTASGDSVRTISGDLVCTYNGSETDCQCANDEVAIAGGACAGSRAGGGSIVESRPTNPKTWRIACESSAGVRIECIPAYATVTCLKVAQ